MRLFISALVVVCCQSLILKAQTVQQPWRTLTFQETESLEEKQFHSPWKETFSFQLDHDQLKSILNRSFLEKSGHKTILNLPLGQEKTAGFELVPEPVLPPALGKNYPGILTFKGISTDERAYFARMSWTGKGFHAIISTPEGTYFIDPHPSKTQQHYISYPIQNNLIAEHTMELSCGVQDHQEFYNEDLQAEMLRLLFESSPEKSNTLPLRKYTIAVACTGEYAQYHGGTVEKALEAIVILVNRLNMVLERDLGITLELAAENDKIIFLDAVNDPYTNGDAGRMLDENANYLSVAFGAQKYDLGHVVGTNTSLNGIAYTGVVCVNTVQKAGGVSTMPNPEGDPFAIAVFGHEVGHQLGASHTFSSCHNIFQPTSFEPGGGTTIMSYAGICSNPVNNLQATADDYYHNVSLEQILFLTREGSGKSCAELVPTNNERPELFIPLSDGFYIPASTPFKLEAEAFDANGDSLTYCWEQFDLGPINSPPGSPRENSPLFRSMPPQPSPVRYFPMLSKVVENEYNRSEVLPAYDRDLTFRCTVRDNHPESGAVNWAQVKFRSTQSAGPFKVMTPQIEGAQWKVGELREVKWDVANTNNEMVNCQYVNILLSMDGGKTFDKILLSRTPNDGSAMVPVPNVVTQTGRIMVEAADNIFFDVSDFNLEIWPPAKPTYFANVTPSSIPQVCIPDAAEFTIQYNALMGFTQPLNFALLGDLPKGAVVEFSRATVQPLPELQEVYLKIYLDDSVTDTFELKLQISSPELDTTYRDIRLITRSNDYSSLAALQPLGGAIGIAPQRVRFSWSDVPDADYYTFEIATNPSFADSTVFVADLLTDTSLAVENLLAPNTIYYWRVRGNSSICGPGPFLEANAFQTVTSACRTYSSEDTPVNISGTGLPTIQSVIDVPEGGAIEDLNIPIVDVNYQPIKSLRFTLISPEGQSAVLYDQGCGNTIRFLSGFDDEANDEVVCPPDDGIPFKPVDSLEQYIGATAAGNWTLQVKVVESGFGASGGLSKWSIEFCSELSPAAPTLLVNDTLKTAPGINRLIDQSLLLSADAEFSDNQLRYTLITLPDNGDLLLDFQPLRAGHSFTQADINAGLLTYQHSDNGGSRDHFTFLLSNPEGGWIDKEQFDILIDESFLTSTSELAQQPDLTVFPNPADQQLNVSLKSDQSSFGWIQVYDAFGRQVFNQQVERISFEQWSIPTSDWSEGLFVLVFRNEQGLVSRKVLIVHN